MSPETFLHLQEVLIFLTSPAALGFPFWYHLKLRWRESVMGRHVMGYSSVVALLYLQAVVAIFWPVYPGRDYVALLLEVLLMIVVWWRVIVFIRLRRQTHPVSKTLSEEKPEEI